MNDWQWKKYWASSAGSVLTVAQLLVLVFGGSGDVRWLTLSGVVLWCAGVAFSWIPIFQFKRQGGVAKGASYVKTTRLVDTGIYSVVRHPQFISWPMFSIAMMLMAQTWLVSALGVVSIALYCMDFTKVDEMNVEKFGDEYRDYMRRVPGWNPLAGIWRRLRHS